MANPTAEEMVPLFQALISYMLYERENETELRTAFACTVQERHHHFHDKDEYTETEFAVCTNEVCVKALAILQQARKPRVEINQFSAAMIENYNLRVEKTQNAVIAYLEDKGLTVKPPALDGSGIVILES